MRWKTTIGGNKGVIDIWRLDRCKHPHNVQINVVSTDRFSTYQRLITSQVERNRAGHAYRATSGSNSGQSLKHVHATKSRVTETVSYDWRSVAVTSFEGWLVRLSHNRSMRRCQWDAGEMSKTQFFIIHPLTSCFRTGWSGYKRAVATFVEPLVAYDCRQLFGTGQSGLCWHIYVTCVGDRHCSQSLRRA
jgi:hypothetical protein